MQSSAPPTPPPAAQNPRGAGGWFCASDSSGGVAGQLAAATAGFRAAPDGFRKPQPGIASAAHSCSFCSLCPVTQHPQCPAWGLANSQRSVKTGEDGKRTNEGLLPLLSQLRWLLGLLPPNA